MKLVVGQAIFALAASLVDAGRWLWRHPTTTFLLGVAVTAGLYRAGVLHGLDWWGDLRYGIGAEVGR